MTTHIYQMKYNNAERRVQRPHDSTFVGIVIQPSLLESIKTCLSCIGMQCPSRCLPQPLVLLLPCLK